MEGRGEGAEAFIADVQCHAGHALTAGQFFLSVQDAQALSPDREWQSRLKREMTDERAERHGGEFGPVFLVPIVCGLVAQGVGDAAELFAFRERQGHGGAWGGQKLVPETFRKAADLGVPSCFVGVVGETVRQSGEEACSASEKGFVRQVGASRCADIQAPARDGAVGAGFVRNVRRKPEALAGADQPVGMLGTDGHDAAFNTEDLAACMGVAFGDPARFLLHVSTKEPRRSGVWAVCGGRGHEGIGAHESNYGLRA